MTCNKRLY
jgi:hypothetical protein